MALYRLVNGVAVQLTPDEEAAQLAEWSANTPPTPEQARLATIDDNIRTTTIGTATPKSVAELKAMDWPAFSAWFDANFDTAAKLIGLVKRLTVIIVRRLL